eukprot:4619866-Alexandrium_andersonii.AAC.1
MWTTFSPFQIFGVPCAAGSKVGTLPGPARRSATSRGSKRERRVAVSSRVRPSVEGNSLPWLRLR